MNDSRREFLGVLARGAGALAIGGVIGEMIASSARDGTANQQPVEPAGNLWQIDPVLCIQCGKCATHCVLSHSAVRCFHKYADCGYCDLCTAFFEAAPNALTTAAENQTCPTAAIKRTFVEDPYYSYEIDRNLCIGCAKCVKGCTAYGNGSMYLQIDHEHCQRCNRCAIAQVCPSQAIRRVHPDQPYNAPRVRGT